MSNPEGTSPIPDQVDRLISGARNILKERDNKPSRAWTISNVATLIALVLSLTTAGWTLYERFLSQPNPEVVAPNIINLFCLSHKVDGKWQCKDLKLRVTASPLVFLNHSYAANSYLVSDAWVTVSFRKDGVNHQDSVELRWQFFSNATDSKVTRDSIVPIEVRSGQPQSREVEFTARRNVAADGTVEFINNYPFERFWETTASDNVNEIMLDFTFTLHPSGDTLTTTCLIPIGADLKTSAASQKHVMYSRDCHHAG